MPKPVRVTPETMRGQGTDLLATGNAMATGLQGLAATIDGAGSPWGGDDQGSLFAGLYQAVLTKAFEGIASHVQQVQYAGTALSAQAQGYAGTESGLTEAFTSAAGEISA